MRTFRSLLLPALLFLTACRTAPSEAPGPTALPPPTATAPLPTLALETPAAIERTIRIEAEDLAGTAITFRHPWNGSRGDLLDALVARFNQENAFEIVVSVEHSAEIFESTRLDLQQNTAPNIVAGFNYHVLAWREVAELPDLSPYQDDPVWGAPNGESQDIFPEFLSQVDIAGSLTGLPFYRTAEVLFYNATWARELGFVSPPETPDALREQACAANAALRRTSNGAFTPYGGLALTFEPTALTAWMMAFNGGFQKITEDEAYTFDRPENIEAFVFLRALLDDGCAWTPDDVYPHAEFADRRSLFMQSTLAGIPAQQAAMDDSGSTDEWIVLPYPTPSGKPAVVFYGPDLVLLPGTAVEQLAGWIFMTWLTSPEHNIAWFDATGYFPAGQSAATAVIQAAPWLPTGKPLPAAASWPYVQWAVSDTARVLYAPLITTSDAEAIAAQLDLLAEELAQLNR